ncbi:NifU family protein [Chlamydia sp. 17-3921]|uniref:NifU family protein n=1 Tax=Chlamydia sp. 17-3921 TaxID=2675798 RepID=UPI001918D2D6|nr:NifU family protein [Chlamydia sp. 17-3921]
MTIPFQPIASWATFSTKVMKKLLKPYCSGKFSEEDAEAKDAHLAIGKQGHRLMGNCVIFYWLIDKGNGKVLDAKFQYFGNPYLIPLAEVTCNLVIGKSYAQAYKISIDDIDGELRSHPEKPALPEDSLPLYHFIIDALDIAIEQCLEIPLEDGPSFLGETPAFPGMEDATPYGKEAWEALDIEKKLQILRTTTDEKISPYVALDGGAVTIETLEENVVTIAYAGNCSGCPSSIGTTLNSIGQLLRAYVYAELQIKVQEESLSFSQHLHDSD